MPEAIHVLLTDYDRFGWGISSPQLPELIGGRDTYEELVADLNQLLEFGGAKPDAPRVIHHQKYIELANGDELMVRMAQDGKAEDRLRVGMHLATAMGVAAQLTDMLKAPRRPTGEVLFICVEPDDTLGWVSTQLNQQDAGCLVLQRDADKLHTLFIAHGKTSTDGWDRAEHVGWAPDTTVLELFEAQDSGKVARGQLVCA